MIIFIFIVSVVNQDNKVLINLKIREMQHYLLCRSNLLFFPILHFLLHLWAVFYLINLAGVVDQPSESRFNVFGGGRVNVLQRFHPCRFPGSVLQILPHWADGALKQTHQVRTIVRETSELYCHSASDGDLGKKKSRQQEDGGLKKATFTSDTLSSCWCVIFKGYLLFLCLSPTVYGLQFHKGKRK